MRRRRASALLALAAAAYALAAWTVPPGFYDGFSNPTTYHWLSPPPNLAGSNQQPRSGHATVTVLSSGSAPATAFTGDGQLVASFVPGAFQPAAGQTSVSVDITPEASYPKLSFRPATNIYLVTADAPLTKPALVELLYSDQVTGPNAIFTAPATGGTWRALSVTQVSQIYTISARTGSLGYFAAGYAGGGGGGPAPPPRGGGGSVVPIVIAAVILLVLLGGIPLVLLRRGRSEEDR